ncbi:MAG: photosynthetic reaction center cytochrome c subunit, partial [Chlorobia bacterium]|nr:photosynthetic reaction center cytochrome c subunit [Fimbriimonadaceae bacterium]
MLRIAPRLFFFALATTPFIVAMAQQTGAKPAPTAEQVFKDVKVFKGVPASDMIPAMQFMSASMNYSCGDCHEGSDYAADNKNKEVTRKMILMQREINQKNFNGRLEVTCMTCHSKKEHPEGMPLPTGISRHHK